MSLCVHRYSSVQAFCDAVEALGVNILLNGRDTKHALMELRTLGGMDGEDWMYIKKEAKAIGRRIDATFERPKREWIEAPMGAYPVVPEVLSGYPMPMRMVETSPFEQSSMRIIVDAGAALGVSGGLRLERGLAIAALAQRLSETRPVQIEVCFAGLVSMGLPERANPEMANQMVLISLGGELEEIVYMIGDPSFAAHLGPLMAMIHAAADMETQVDVWPLWNKLDPDDDYALKVRGAIGLSHEDLYLPMARLGDVEQLHADPVRWLRRIMTQQE